MIFVQLFIVALCILYANCLDRDMGAWTFHGIPDTGEYLKADERNNLVAQIQGEIQAHTLVAPNIYTGHDKYKISLYDTHYTMSTVLSEGCMLRCIYGVTVSTSEGCRCMCYSGWIGDYCDINRCFGNGIYDDTSSICVCNKGYTGVLCEEKIIEIPQVIYPYQYTCKPGFFGQRCDFQCATNIINGTICPYRLNWMQDECFYDTTTSSSICVCGGGYSKLDQYSISINYLICTGNERECVLYFRDVSWQCCAPDMNCALNTIGTCPAHDLLCCRTYDMNSHMCNLAGCIHTGFYCVDYNHWASTYPVAEQPIKFMWYQYKTHWYNDIPFTMSNRLLYTEYMELYSDCYYLYGISNETCLRDTRRILNSRYYSMASINNYFDTIQFSFRNLHTNQFLAAPIPYTQQNIQYATWQNEEAFFFVSSTQTGIHTDMMILAYQQLPSVSFHCLRYDNTLYDTSRAQFGTFVWINIIPLYPVSDVSFDACYHTTSLLKLAGINVSYHISNANQSIVSTTSSHINFTIPLFTLVIFCISVSWLYIFLFK